MLITSVKREQAPASSIKTELVKTWPSLAMVHRQLGAWPLKRPGYKCKSTSERCLSSYPGDLILRGVG